MKTLREIADMAKVSVATVYAWVERGLLPKPSQLGGWYYFEANQVADVLDRLKNQKPKRGRKPIKRKVK